MKRRSATEIRVDAARRLLSSGSIAQAELDELFALQNDAQARLGVGEGEPPHPDDPDLAFAVDVLELLSIVYPDDGSHPWSRAHLLRWSGRRLEAAQDFLRAAALFDQEHRSGEGLSGDEDMWAGSARALAASCLAAEGQPLAAAKLVALLNERDRAFVEADVEAGLDRLDRHAAA